MVFPTRSRVWLEAVTFIACWHDMEMKFPLISVNFISKQFSPKNVKVDFIHFHVIPNLFDLISSVEHKRTYISAVFVHIMESYWTQNV